MPPLPAQKKLTDTVFISITEGSYPEDEDVVSAELPSSVLQGLSVLLEQARADVKASISELSRLSAADIDGWVSQAKQLRHDIDESERRSKEIVTFAAQGTDLQERARDAASKVALLEDEVTFNDSVVGILKKVQELKQTTEAAQSALNMDDISRVTNLLMGAEQQLSLLTEASSTRVIDVIKSRLQELRTELAESLNKRWGSLLAVDVREQNLTINHNVEGPTKPTSLDLVADSLESLDLLQARVNTLLKDFETAILAPCLQERIDRATVSIEVKGNKLQLSQGNQRSSIEALLQDLSSALSFLASQLPQNVVSLLMKSLVPNLISRLLSGVLTSIVPTEIGQLPSFQAAIVQVSNFAEFLRKNKWPGEDELRSWAADAPNIWLAKRSQSSLNSIRQVLRRGLGNSRAVERVETQTVSREDDVFTGNSKQDDWDDGWSDDEKETGVPEKLKDETATPKSNGFRAEEDEDVSGWGFDDENEDEIQVHENQYANNIPESAGKEAAEAGEEDEGDAWGWGEEKQETSTAERNSGQEPAARSEDRQNSALNTHQSKGREVSLKETYHISALPEQVLELIVMAVEDADALVRTGAGNPVVSASNGLYLLPGSVLSMFRASAPNFYANDINGNMFLYNDSLYLAEQLRAFAKHRVSNQAGNFRGGLSLEPEIAAIEVFGKRAYGKEMESQRTIVGDLLDGAQGFANCTEHPFAQQCDLAITSTVDRIRELCGQWSAVLSRSALLQSIGSLLVTITNKMIVDIEDMSDISEPESQHLASFCNRLTVLDDLFLPEQAPDANPNESPIPLTAAYTSTWLKFQYLANILESTLVDIKYLWTEGELSLEFTSSEVVDLIEALFADSEHRRKAISEIRRGVAR